jgi:hypothetical protein
LKKASRINPGANYSNSLLKIVIFAREIKQILKNLLNDYTLVKNICVTSTLKEYKSKSGIIISKPEDINEKNRPDMSCFISRLG